MTNREIEALVSAMSDGLHNVGIALFPGDNMSRALFVRSVQRAIEDGLKAARAAA